MSYATARQHAQNSKTWADRAMAQATDQAIINLAKAVSELGQSQYEMASHLQREQ